MSERSVPILDAKAPDAQSGFLDTIGLIAAFAGGAGAIVMALFAVWSPWVLLGILPLGIMLNRLRRNKKKDKTTYRPLIRGLVACAICAILGITCLMFSTGWPLLLMFGVHWVTEEFI